jgi:hypothetical protein
MDGRIQMALEEFESLLYEPGRNGWLYAETVEAAPRLRVNAINPRIYIIPAYAWTHW